MKIIRSDRGFLYLVHPAYVDGELKRLVAHSSAIGDYEDSWERPGTSYLWIGEDHHLDREEVAQLIEHLQHWLATGSLEL